MVFRSVGYRGVALPEIPFHEAWGTVHNNAGRVTQESGEVVPGIYVAGWIKRGPTGVIGTNKTDAQETVACMVEDLKAGKILDPSKPEVKALDDFIRAKKPDVVSYEDWAKINQVEVEKGEQSDRPRVKFTHIAQMLEVLGR